MAKERLCPTGMLKPRGSYSQVVVSDPGRMVFLAGQVALDEDAKVVGVGDIRAQTRQVLQNIKRGVEAVGGTLKDVVSLTVFTTDARYNSDVSEVRREIFGSDLPASTQVEVAGLMRPELLIEISAVAILSTKT
jgi:enamine deaminase RidA (YjgF/YER057c/UK114 family)